MRFFVPCTGNRDDAGGAWAAIRDWLSDMGLETTGRRIAALVCAIDGVDHVLAVGRETPMGDMAVVILESDGLDLFGACPEPSRRICTHGHGVFEGFPYPMALNESWRVVDFEEEGAGHA